MKPSIKEILKMKDWSWRHPWNGSDSPVPLMSRRAYYLLKFYPERFRLDKRRNEEGGMG